MRVHDFEIKGLGKVAPYGVAANQGWFNVGIDADTAEFAVERIPRHTFQGDWNYTISPKQQGPP